MPLTLLLGGARSGKSALTVRLAAGQSAPVVFLATGEGRDQEMAARIEAHRLERPAGWQTVEEPRQLLHAITSVSEGSFLVIDCLTLWISNLLETTEPPEIERQAAAAAEAAAVRPGQTVAVSNEVGMGLVPMDPLGRRYRDLLGRVNTIWARAAEQALLVVAGRTLALDQPPAASNGSSE
jgi:adenosylcobinamide kinase/adenosylcobinamide-phosphate guanylyltransferase